MKKIFRDTCFNMASFFTGSFIWKFVTADYKAGCIIASIAIGFFAISYILARCTK